MVQVVCKYNPKGVFEIELKRPRYTGQKRARNYVILRCSKCKAKEKCPYSRKGKVKMDLYREVFMDVPNATD